MSTPNRSELLDGLHRKPVVASLRSGANANCKPLAAEEWKRDLGKAIERALILANLTKQDVSFRMGYPAGDQSAISKWISAVEPPQWHKLFAIVELRQWLSVALAELAGAEVETIVRVRRLA